MSARPKEDDHLMSALVEAYAARALLFHTGVRMSGIDLLIAEIEALGGKGLEWARADWGISEQAYERLRATGSRPEQVFVHPGVLARAPHLLAYYRNLATLSQKGISQILFPTARYEARSGKEMRGDDAVRAACVLNRIMSRVIEAMPDYTVEVSRQALVAEIGAQLQGSWANAVGRRAAKEVERLIAEYIQENALGAKTAERHYALNNGWEIGFGAEPDVAFLDGEKVKQIAIEIKGSLDLAGAQTRYGEAKKSFAKALAENPRCHTVYLASCYTDAVIRQIEADGQVRAWLNLTSVLYDAAERAHFLESLFHIVRAPRRNP